VKERLAIDEGTLKKKIKKCKVQTVMSRSSVIELRESQVPSHYLHHQGVFKANSINPVGAKGLCSKIKVFPKIAQDEID